MRNRTKMITATAAPATMPTFAQGIINLANDALTILIVISGAIAVGFGVFFIIKWYTADDNEKAPAAKKVRQVVIGAVGVVAFSGILKWVLTYF